MIDPKTFPFIFAHAWYYSSIGQTSKQIFETNPFGVILYNPKSFLVCISQWKSTLCLHSFVQKNFHLLLTEKPSSQKSVLILFLYLTLCVVRVYVCSAVCLSVSVIVNFYFFWSFFPFLSILFCLVCMSFCKSVNFHMVNRWYICVTEQIYKK